MFCSTLKCPGKTQQKNEGNTFQKNTENNSDGQIGKVRTSAAHPAHSLGCHQSI